MALLDTTALIDLSRSKKSRYFPALAVLLRELIGQGQTIHTSRINEAEFRVGGFLSSDPAREIQKIETVLSGVVMLDFDRQAAIRYAEIHAHLTRAGKRTGAADTFIAAMALVNGQPIVTRNPRDFADIPNLSVISY